jgi:selenocysteine-specific elongation factor
VATLHRLAEDPPPAVVAARLVEAGHRGCRLDLLARLVGHAPGRVRGWAEQAGAAILGPGVVLAGDVHRALRRRILLLLDDFHRRQSGEYGMARDRLRELMPQDVADPVLAAIVGQLAAEGRISHHQGLLRASGFRPAAWRVTADVAVARAVAEAFRAGNLMPPDAAAVMSADPRRHQALRQLVRDGVLVEATDRVQQRAIIFHRDAVAAARARIAEHLAGRQDFLVRDVGALLGISRKFSVPLLEHFDRIGFTRRNGDRRVVLDRGRRRADARDGAPAADAPRPAPLSASACRPPRRVPP